MKGSKQLSYCLWCDDEIILQTSWKNFIRKKRLDKLCQSCVMQLNVIHGDRCLICSRESSESICYDCKRWGSFYNDHDPLTWNYSIFLYNDFIKEIITQWKYRGDYVLAEVFKDQLLEHFKFVTSKVNQPFIVVPIPLSDERLYERGFNQSEVLANLISHEHHDILIRTHNEKQSKRSRKERLLSKNPFELTKTIYKSVILVDDIYTTGSTLRQAAILLKESGCPHVYSCTLIRG